MSSETWLVFLVNFHSDISSFLSILPQYLSNFTYFPNVYTHIIGNIHFFLVRSILSIFSDFHKFFFLSKSTSFIVVYL